MNVSHVMKRNRESQNKPSNEKHLKKMKKKPTSGDPKENIDKKGKDEWHQISY